jgi:sugar phosphate isomerase/epimerase
MLLSFNSRALGLDLGPIQSIQLASKAGFDAVDLLVRDLVDHGPPLHLIADALRERNLRPGAWPLPVQWRGCREVYRLDLARLPVHAQAAQNLGLHATATWVFPAWPDPPPDGLPSHKDALGWQVDRLTPIARILTDHGIALGLEIIGIPAARQGAAFPLIHRHADLPVLLDLFDPSLLVGYLFDSFHLAATDEDPATLLELPERYPIVWVHLAELPGGLRIDLSWTPVTAPACFPPLGRPNSPGLFCATSRVGASSARSQSRPWPYPPHSANCHQRITHGSPSS